jgi:hypothetical protein
MIDLFILSPFEFLDHSSISLLERFGDRDDELVGRRFLALLQDIQLAGRYLRPLRERTA